MNIQLFPCHVCSQGVYGQLYRYCVVTETDYVGMLPANDVPDRNSWKNTIENRDESIKVCYNEI
ncbi:MAG: hypothetical protein K1W13_01125 [Lachnospiraceae bacterium]